MPKGICPFCPFAYVSPLSLRCPFVCPLVCPLVCQLNFASWSRANAERQMPRPRPQCARAVCGEFVARRAPLSARLGHRETPGQAGIGCRCVSCRAWSMPRSARREIWWTPLPVDLVDPDTIKANSLSS
jgi:hypothetical protein